MSNARKLFRMLKSLMEYKKINAILSKADTTPIHRVILLLIPRISSFFYWILDTIIVLAKIKFLTNVDIKWVTYRYAFLWTITNFVQAFTAIVDYFEVSKEEAKLIAEKQFNNKKMNETKDSSDLRAREEDLRKRRFAAVLTLIKNLGDSIASTQLLGWPQKYLGFEFNDGAVGLGGLASGLIGSYTIYPSASKK